MKKQITLIGTSVLLFLGLALLFLAGFWRQDQASEAAIVTELGQLRTAELLFQKDHEHYACTLAELNKQSGLMDPDLASGNLQGYDYELRCRMHDGLSSFEAWAVPEDPPPFSKRYCIATAGPVYSTRHDLDDCTQGRPLR